MEPMGNNYLCFFFWAGVLRVGPSADCKRVSYQSYSITYPETPILIIKD